MKCSIRLVAACLWGLSVLVSTTRAVSPYDTPYGVQWSFMIGQNVADNPVACTEAPDGTVWISTQGSGKTSDGPTLTWGNPTGVYGGWSASGYGQLSRSGFILQGNDLCVVPGISNLLPQNSVGCSVTVLR